MLKLAQVPEDHSAAQPHIAASRVHRLDHRYYAFLSYSHKDEEVAGWLHSELERFKVPRPLQGKLTAMGVIPPRLTPIFRDRHELAAADDLGAEIRNALASSQYLIVLCSPAAAQSRWTNAEIETFKRTRPEGCVLAVIVDGEPFATDVPGHDDMECFPPALRYKYDRRGRLTSKRAEPLAADLRETGDGKRLGFLKLVAGMLGVGLDDLVQRENIRRHRRLAFLAAASLAGMAVTSTLAITAIQARDAARDQRRQAEGLVGFMLGDLKDKLEPIGRLDALDAVGSRALAYYQNQDKSELSDESLAQRSRALTLMGEIANTRGDLDGALGRYREAMASTEELARRWPDDPQRLFDHAQNVFWVGEIAHQRGRMAEAERAMREYKLLADNMVSLDPNNQKWQLEVKYANSSLGALLYEQNRYAEASKLLQQSLDIVQRLGAADPTNAQYKKSAVETLGWLADSRFGEGLVDEAIAAREQQVAFLDRLIGQYPNDATYPQQAIAANRALGRLLAASGDSRGGIQHLQRAAALGEKSLAAEPDNSDTISFTAGTHLDLAKVLAAAGRYEDAAAETRSGCVQTNRLLALDQKVAEWQQMRFDCFIQRSSLALQRGASDEALLLARNAFTAAQSVRARSDANGRINIARVYKIMGDIQMGRRNTAAASAAWKDALAVWPKNITETPRQLAVRMELLKSLGQSEQARQIQQKLAAMGYRQLI